MGDHKPLLKLGPYKVIEHAVRCFLQAGVSVAVSDEIFTTAAGKILIVGHAGVNRIILSRALGMPLENMFRIKQDYGCLNILKTKDLVLQVERLNLIFANGV